MKNTKIENDSRFYINPNDLERLNKRKIRKYKLEEIPIGKIRRYLDGKIFDLYKTDAYKLLENPSNIELEEKYDAYCKNYCYKYENRNQNNFMKLANKLDQEEYNPNKGIIVVDQLYIIADGQHRSCVLLNKYGPKYKVKVLKIYCSDIGIKTYARNLIYMIQKRL